MPCLFPLVSNYRTSSPTATSLTVLTPGQTRQLTAPAHDWLTTSDRTCPHPTSNFIIWPRISTGIYRCGTIIEQRNRIANVVEESPSLAPHAARLEKAYADGRRIAQGETGVAMPERCPWTIAQVLDNEF